MVLGCSATVVLGSVVGVTVGTGLGREPALPGVVVLVQLAHVVAVDFGSLQVLARSLIAHLPSFFGFCTDGNIYIQDLSIASPRYCCSTVEDGGSDTYL